MSLSGLIACKIHKFLAETQRNRLKRDEENERKLLEYAGYVFVICDILPYYKSYISRT